MSGLVLVANAGDGTITSLRLDPTGDPTLTTLTSTPVGKGCGTLAVDSERGLVYAATKEPSIVTLRIDEQSGALSEAARREIDEELAYVTLAPGGEVVLGASYSGGCAMTWLVGPKAGAAEGVVGDEVSRVEYANCHCVVTDAGGRHAYVVSLGDDLVAQFDLAADGTLTPMEPATVAMPDGCGPRHLEIDGDVAYLVTEYSAQVFRLGVTEDGRLVRDESAEPVRIDSPEADLAHSVMGADPAKERLRWGADVHRTGRWLLASERTASTIATVALGQDGRLEDVVAITDTEKQPRAFGIAPDGINVVAVGEKSIQAALSRVEDDGSLTLLDTAEVGETARWVAFV